MKPTEQIESLASAFSQKCDPLNQTLEKQADIRQGYKAGFMEAISQMQPEWVECSERLPDTGVPVLVYLPKYGTPNIVPMWIEEMTGNWFNTAWQFKRIDEATHWMPLPNPPKSV